MALVCIKNEVAANHCAAYKHGLLYDGRPDGRFGVRHVDMCNVGSLSGKGG